jgi:hypothetical protein
MSTLAEIIAQINSLTEYQIPIPSGSVVTASVSNATGSVNDIINQINNLSGYLIPTVTGSFTTSSIAVSTGSVNNIISLMNQQTGFMIPYTSGSIITSSMASGSGSLNSIISTINLLTGFNIPSASGYIISASGAMGTGSINDIVTYVNNLTGYSIPYTSASVVSGSLVGSQPLVIYTPPPVSGTIPTTGIRPGAIIEAEHLLRIINALNGVNPNLIVLSGSLYVSGSATMARDLNLPFTFDQNVLLSQTGSVSGSAVLDGGSF